MATASGSVSRSVRLGGRAYPVVLPTRRDPRLWLAAVIFSLQFLGQAVLGFQLSIAQILVCLLTCAVLEVGLTFRREGVVMWPASALLTGNGVAFILRVTGTRHGDWWSLHGAGIFAGTAAVSLLSKYVIRVRGHHLFNPSNIGLLLCFLVLGTRRVNPQDLWWGPVSPRLVLTLVIILAGGLVIVTRLRMLGLALAFWLTFAGCIGIIAASGHCMTARWHVGPVCGWSFWWVLVTSPEILVFLFFMITDPKTTPQGSGARVLYGAGVALVAALLVAPERTEFATKVAVLGGLAAMSAVRPLLAGRFRSWPAGWAAGRNSCLVVAAVGVAGCALCVGLLVVAGIPARPAAAVSTSGRPAVAINPFAIPAVNIDPAVESDAPSVTQAVAQQMVEDLVADLQIEADALRQRRPDLAATVAGGASLRQLQQTIGSAGAVAVPTYSFASLTVVIVRDPRNPQASPQLGVRALGVVDVATYGASSSTEVTGRRQSTYDLTLVLQRAGAHYLIMSS